VRLTVPPVLGGALIGLEAGGVRVTPEIRKTINASIASVQGLTVKPA
jgi:hypothetical protein